MNEIQGLYLDNTRFFLYSFLTSLTSSDIETMSLLSNGTKLRILSMNNNSIDDTGFSQLLGYLKNVPSLEQFYIKENHITAASIPSIVDYIRIIFLSCFLKAFLQIFMSSISVESQYLKAVNKIFSLSMTLLTVLFILQILCLSFLKDSV